MSARSARAQGLVKFAACTVSIKQLRKCLNNAVFIDWICLHARLGKSLVKIAAVLIGSSKSPVNVRVSHLRVE